MSTQTTHPQSTQDPKNQKDNVHNASPEYPFCLYNHKTRQTKAAKDKDDYDKLTSQGFEEDPFEPVNPDLLTGEEVKILNQLLAKAAKALEKLGQLQSDETDKTTGKTTPAPAKK